MDKGQKLMEVYAMEFEKVEAARLEMGETFSSDILIFSFSKTCYCYYYFYYFDYHGRKTFLNSLCFLVVVVCITLFVCVLILSVQGK